ncbi:hypothetical protein [Rhizobacter sp. Root1221]|uniref:hypothetical protein n=1 Tax=Rhizobacter sp. Root1221 TaxID=1736433 RepID=UPI0006F39B78|nr:hypothetical protein [Rhizobacter sp. Root1221]KQV99985.1 hypothetical protein ASC87_19995 [Rhizobacter sp. Root1221]
MIQFVIKGFAHIAAFLERLADRETLRTQAKLEAASKLVEQANGHRKLAFQGRKVATALRDITKVD